MEFDFLKGGFEPVLATCRSEDLTGAIKEAEKLSGAKHTVQLFDSDKSILGRIVPAYLNASLRSFENCLRTKSVRSEMIIFVSGKMDIRKAIELCGAKGDTFIVFASDAKTFSSFLKKSTAAVVKKHRPSIDYAIAEKVAATELESE